MIADQYQLVFRGHALDNFEDTAVKEAFSKFFKVNAAKVETFFNGEQRVVSTNLDKASADRYADVLARNGIAAFVEPMPQVESANDDPADSADVNETSDNLAPSTEAPSATAPSTTAPESSDSTPTDSDANDGQGAVANEALITTTPWSWLKPATPAQKILWCVFLFLVVLRMLMFILDTQSRSVLHAHYTDEAKALCGADTSCEVLVDEQLEDCLRQAKFSGFSAMAYLESLEVRPAFERDFFTCFIDDSGAALFFIEAK